MDYKSLGLTISTKFHKLFLIKCNLWTFIFLSFYYSCKILSDVNCILKVYKKINIIIMLHENLILNLIPLKKKIFTFFIHNFFFIQHFGKRQILPFHWVMNKRYNKSQSRPKDEVLTNILLGWTVSNSISAVNLHTSWYIKLLYYVPFKF